jgi:hypothetical protein
MLPSTTAFSEPDMDRLTLAPFAPQPSAFGQHAERMPPYSATPCLPTPLPSSVLGHPQMPPMPASSGVPVNSLPCSLDIPRPDPETLMLWHVASIPTRSTGLIGIPTVPGAGDGAFPSRERAARRDHHAATAHNALVGGPGAASRRSLLEARAGARAAQGGWVLDGGRSARAPAHGHARPDIRSFAPPASPGPCSPPASSPFGRWFDDTPAYANGARDEHPRKAAWAQDESQREIARRTPRRRGAALPPAGEPSASERGTYADAEARDRAFVAGVGLKRRKPIHATHKHVCPLCRRAFNRPSGLRVHEYSHIGHRRTSLLPPCCTVH